MSDSNAELPLVRRTRRAAFVPPDPEQVAGPAVSRQWSLGARPSGQTQLPRNRKIAGNLPSWDPTPPGEVLVRRGSAT